MILPNLDKREKEKEKEKINAREKLGKGRMLRNFFLKIWENEKCEQDDGERK